MLLVDGIDDLSVLYCLLSLGPGPGRGPGVTPAHAPPTAGGRGGQRTAVEGHPDLEAGLVTAREGPTPAASPGSIPQQNSCLHT